MKVRYSPQRETILNIILKHDGHLSVEKIFDESRKQLPKISLGTVYRNLKQLEDMHSISHMQGTEQSYYEGYKDPHHHFICTSCRSITNLDTPTVNICTGCLKEKVPMQVDDIVTTLYGLCDNCKK